MVLGPFRSSGIMHPADGARSNFGWMLPRLALWCVRRRRLVVFGIWIPALIILFGISGAVGTDFHTQFQLPSGEAKDVFRQLETVSKEAAGFDAQIVIEAPKGVADE